MISLLKETTIKIKEGFKSSNIHRYTDVANHYKSLAISARDQDSYIQKYENFWFTFEILQGIADELALLVGKVEELKPTLRKLEHTEQLRDLLLCRRLICNDIYTLISLLRDANVIPTEWQRNYKELRYVYLLRKDLSSTQNFLIHLKLLACSLVGKTTRGSCHL